MKKVTILFRAAALLVAVFVFSVPESRAAAGFSIREKQLFRKAESHFIFAEYDEAIPLYSELLQSHDNDARLNYQAGICYYYSSTSRPLSVPFLLKALRFTEGDTATDLLFHAGKACLSVNRFEEAETYFRILHHRQDCEYDRNIIDALIVNCENGKKMWAHPAPHRIANLGPNVNSVYPDYAPVITRDHKKLLFTSKRKGTTGGRKDEEGYYYEDVYSCRATPAWTSSSRYDTTFVKPRFYDLKLFFGKAENITQINTSRHDGSIVLSPDGRSLYIFRSDDIWRADMDGDSWKHPVRLSKGIDGSNSYEPSVFVTHDEQTLFFVSDRKGGLGGKDIWTCTKNSAGDWGTPTDLGAEINTKLDEDCPYVTDDGNTLYFSSQGHDGMGGYDVFRCKKDGSGKWSAPENLGAPINNGDDDVFFVPDEGNDRAWYATLNKEGEGSLDIYEIDFFLEFKPMAKIRLADDSKFGGEAHVAIRGLAGGMDTAFTISKDKTALYPVTPSAGYVMTVTAEGFLPFTDTVNAPADRNENFFLQEISLSRTTKIYGFTEDFDLRIHQFDIDRNLRDSVTDYLLIPAARQHFVSAIRSVNDAGYVYTTTTFHVQHTEGSGTSPALLTSIFFDYDASLIRADMEADVNALLKWMKENPAEKVELAGFADDRGSDDYNIRLSQRRAEAVSAFLVANGIDVNRITVKGNGEAGAVPPGINANGVTTDDGRSKYRRVDINIRR